MKLNISTYNYVRFHLVLAFSLIYNNVFCQATTVSATNTPVASTDYIGWSNATDLDFKTSGNQYMRLLGATGTPGYFGIGLNLPLLRLEVNDDIGVIPNIWSDGYHINTIPVLRSWPITAQNNIFVGRGAGFNSNNSGDHLSFIGRDAGIANTTGDDNTFLGFNTGIINSVGFQNTFLGSRAGISNVSGDNNTFVGFEAGRVNIFDENTFVGAYAGTNNTSGSQNTFVGFEAGLLNSTGASNTFFGRATGDANTTGQSNAFFGNASGTATTTGSFNVFLGTLAGQNNTIGDNNVAVGDRALGSVTINNDNTAIGFDAGIVLTNGHDNFYGGTNAGFAQTTGIENVFLGSGSGSTLLTGSNHTLIGFGTIADNNLTNASAIGSNAWVRSSNSMILGDPNTFVGIGLSGITGGPQTPLEINTSTPVATGNSGLRFRDLTNASPASLTGITRVLTVDSDGDVVLGDIPGLGGPVQACSGGLTATNYVTKITASNEICKSAGIYESSATYSTVGIGLSNTAWLSTAHKLHIQGDLLIQRDNTSPGYIGGIYMYNGSGIQRVFAQYGSTNYRSLVIGADAGPANLASSTALGSIYIGYHAGRNTANHSSNIFIGDNAGVAFSGYGSENTFIGASVADLWDDGSDNTVLGFKAADDVLDGDYNTYLGSYSGSFLDNGDYNVFIGYGASLESLYANTGDKNVLVGAGASGFDNTSGTDLYNAGTIGYSGRVYCDNCFTIGAQLSTGVTSQQTVGIGIANPGAYTIPGLVGGPAKLLVGNMGGTQPTSAFFSGDIYVTGTYNPSDAFLKTNIQPYTDAMQIIDQLEAKSYEFNLTAFPTLGLEPGNHFGFMADDISALLPQLVRDFSRPAEFDSSGNILNPQVDFKAVNYSGLIPILFTAIKQQQTQLDSLAQALSLCCSVPIVNPQGNRSSIELSNHASIILNQNSPNPFKEKTDIKYSIPENIKDASILFYDQKGIIFNSFEINHKGEGSLTVYGENLSAGIYTYSLIVDGEIFTTKKMIKE